MEIDLELPSGKVVPIEVADLPEAGWTPEQKVKIANELIKQGAATKEDFGGFVPEPFTPNQELDPGVNPIAGNLEQLGAGVTLGHSDEIQALTGAISTTGQTGLSFAERYKQIRDSIRADRDKFIEQEGPVAYVPELVGGAMTAASGLMRTATLPEAIKVGIGEGMAAGAGYADAPEYLSLQTAGAAGGGGAIGAATAPVAAITGRLGSHVFEKGVNAVKEMAPNLTGVSKKYHQQMDSDLPLDDEMAKFLPAKGPTSTRVRKNPFYTEARKQGISDQFVNSINEASPADRKALLEMLNIVEGGQKSSAFRRTHRVEKVAGDTLLKPFQNLIKVNRDAGRKINEVAMTTLKGQPFPEIRQPLTEFAERLQEHGVDLVRKTDKKTGEAKIALDFENSTLSRGDRAAVKEVFRHVVLTTKSGVPDAYQAHRLKRAIDNNVTWGKGDNLTADAESMLKGLRISIDDALDAKYPAYNTANADYAETISVMNDLRGITGKRFDPDDKMAADYLGRTMRALTGERQIREELYRVIGDIEQLSAKHGVEMAGSPQRQAYFVIDLADRFGLHSETGFTGATQRATADALADVMKGDKSAVVTRTLKGVADAATGVSEKKAVNVLRLLAEAAGTETKRAAKAGPSAVRQAMVPK